MVRASVFLTDSSLHFMKRDSSYTGADESLPNTRGHYYVVKALGYPKDMTIVVNSISPEVQRLCGFQVCWLFQMPPLLDRQIVFY